MRTITFNYPPFAVGGSYEEYLAHEDYVALRTWMASDEYRALYKTLTFWQVDLSNVKIELREAIAKHTGGAGHSTFEIVEGYAIVDNATGKRVSRDTKFCVFTTEKAAQKELASMIKRKAEQAAEDALLAEHDEVTRRLAFCSNSEVATLPLPSATTQVGDVVQVRGFGKQRAGLVIECSGKRVKCIVRTVESTKRQNDNGYTKWFTRGA